MRNQTGSPRAVSSSAALGGGDQRRRGGSTQYEPELDQLPGQTPTFGIAAGARSEIGMQNPPLSDSCSDTNPASALARAQRRQRVAVSSSTRGAMMVLR